MSRGSVLPEGMTLAGEIRGQGDLVVAGTIEGPVAIDGHLTIEATGAIRGEVKARALVLRGTLVGHAVAEETIRLEPGAKMVGDARAERVSVVEGAMLRGRITMTGAQASRRSSAGMITAAGQLLAPGARSSAGQLSSPGAVASPGVTSPGTLASGAVTSTGGSSPGDLTSPGLSSPGAISSPGFVATPRALVGRVEDVAGVAPRAERGVISAPREPEERRERRERRPIAERDESRDADPRDGRRDRRERERREGERRAAPTRDARAEDELEGRPTGRFARVEEPARATAQLRAEEPAVVASAARRPPAPVIPGVGRQRARRKDVGA